ncbi:MAG: LuxR C-terminal-related transcriptional regulator [Alistipes sp.]|nr:LuxR C-terminal-related transcriptional regulator [Alistipes sp.]
MADTRTYKVLLLEPSEIVAAGLRKMMAGSEFRLLDTDAPADVATAMEHLQVLEPDVVVVNPSIFDSMRRMSIRAAYPQLHDVSMVAVAYSVYDEEMLKEFDGVVNIFDSQSQIMRKLRQSLVRSDSPVQSESYELSDREREILISIARGKTNKEIADRHNISIHTVISHRKNISRKTGIKTIAGLTVYALLNNMIAESDME